MAVQQVDLGPVDAQKLRAAVEGTLARAGDVLPTSESLRRGAEATLSHPDQDVSKMFQAILEITYLVASADGFAEEERHALARLLESVTERAVDYDTLELHLRDLDDACEMLGRRERLRRAAEDFGTEAARKQALCFAALVAMADGKLAEPEAKVLDELGGHLGCTPDDVAALTQQMAEKLRTALAS